MGENQEPSVSPLQAMMDGFGAAWQKERAATQMTLGGLIAELEALEAETKVKGFGRPHSYRGYYGDLAFEPDDEAKKAVDVLVMCRSCMGKVFTGYKGGDFMMGENTPVWISHYGTTAGPGRIMSLEVKDGVVHPRCEPEEW